MLGECEEIFLGSVKSRIVKICPEDYHGITPRPIVRVNDRVKAGDALFFSKDNPEIFFTSPVSGVVKEIERGAKRRILNFVLEADGATEYRVFGAEMIESLSAEEIKGRLLEAGLWFLIKQRPYDLIAFPKKEPRDIFVTGFDTAPLAPSYDFILEGRESDLQAGLDAVAKLTKGRVYLSIGSSSNNRALLEAKNVVLTRFEGPHPAGNVGVQINHIKPVNRGEVVWTVNLLDILMIGRLFNSGVVDMTRMVAFCGSELKNRGYYKMVIGTELKEIFKNNLSDDLSLRYISGNPLTGRRIDSDGVLRAYDSQVTVIPEGDDRDELLGWASFSPKRYSAGGTYLKHRRKYRLDARLLGGRRAIICSNEYDKVFPMDIFPEQLIKATLAFNIEKMEQLGIYEVAPEDFALCEFVDTSKLEIQRIIRTGLDLLRKEME